MPTQKVYCPHCGVDNNVQVDKGKIYTCVFCAKQFSIKPDASTEGETSAAVGLIGGALLGASIGGPPGAIIGAILGAIIGKGGKGVG